MSAHSQVGEGGVVGPFIPIKKIPSRENSNQRKIVKQALPAQGSCLYEVHVQGAGDIIIHDRVSQEYRKILHMML